LQPVPQILVYGYGNPGRQDDGLGTAFVAALQRWLAGKKLAHINTDSNYQLNIEDALALRDKDIVIFVDASRERLQDFTLTEVSPSATVAFTMHAVSPAFVLALCQDLYHKNPRTYLLHIKGYRWGMREGLTTKAGRNLDSALVFLQEKLQKPESLLQLPGLAPEQDLQMSHIEPKQGIRS
jgi:hydrogenase maturation protease